MILNKKQVRDEIITNNLTSVSMILNCNICSNGLIILRHNKKNNLKKKKQECEGPVVSE